MNQHGFGRPGSGTLIQRVVCSAVGNPDARALRISDVRWERVNLALLGQRILRVRSGYRLRNINAVARLKLSYTFSDAFDVIHGRLSASQFNATEVATYMSQLVEQITETERFVDTLRPSIDGLMVGMNPTATGRGPGAVRQGGRG